jgi:hypothetical protein
MSLEESFRDRTFRVEDPDSLIRAGKHDLLSPIKYGPGDPLPNGMQVGDNKRIPVGTMVRVTEVAMIEAGSETQRAFALTTDLTGGDIGWTSTRNFAGKFRNITLGVLRPESGAGRYGPNATWSGGSYRGQIDLILIISAELKIRQIALNTADAYFQLVEAAAADDIFLGLNSGFRSYPEQKYLYEGYERRLPGFNKAAKPGSSLHQNGIAFDLDVNALSGNAIYDWLTQRAPAFGFFRTVNGEPWHWEYDPDKATQLIATGTFKTENVIV